jgi:REP element-mobilizing transposase RayT
VVEATRQLSWVMPTPPKKRVRLTAKGLPARMTKDGRPFGRPRMHAPGTGVHVPRPALAARTPVHVTMRLVDDISNARKFKLYKALRWAVALCFLRRKARICHISIQKTHVHAIVEAEDAVALSRGMQGFQISAARGMNRALGRTGKVFADRFHAEQLTSPTQTRNTIRYVLNNWRHHGLDRRGPLAGFRVDVFSSAPTFGGYSDYNEDGLVHIGRWPKTYDGLQTWLPRSWLLSVGWRERGGGPFSVWDVPGEPSARGRR